MRRLLAFAAALLLAAPAHADWPAWTIGKAFLGGSIAGPILNDDGTAAAPSYAFSSDTDNGIYRVGNNQLALTSSSDPWWWNDALASNPTTNKSIVISGGAAGSTGDIFLKRYAAKQLSITGDGIGASGTNTGWILGNVTADQSGIWASSITPSTSNYNIAAGSTYISVAGPGASGTITLLTNSTTRWTVNSSGHFIAGADNTYDFGAIGATRPRNVFVAGNVYLTAPVTNSGTTYTVAATDNFLIANAAATQTLTLPTASSNTGRTIRVKTTAAFTVVSASSNVVPLIGGAAGTAILAATAGKWADLTSDGTNWVVMAGN
jgi:hypothetical protein